jgi:meiotically up-regulated gene 157 (Mug157) protein
LKKKINILLILFLLFIPLIACDQKPIEVDNSEFKIKNGGFENGNLKDWTIISGNAFSDAGVTDNVFYQSGTYEVDYNKDGTYLYGTYHEQYTGRMKSSTFKIGGSNYISFKLGAGNNVGLTYISVVDAKDNQELFRFANTKFNSTNYLTDKGNYREANLVGYYADLSLYRGKEVYILVVDDSTANWGYITLDSFVTYYDAKPDLVGYYEAEDIKPVFTDEAGTPNVLYNGDFALNTLAGWEVIGDADAFKAEHINANHRLSNRPNETSVGILRSSSFKVAGTGLISFRLGATKNPELTYLTVKKVRTNEEVFRTYSNRWKDTDEEETHLYYIDLNKYQGECLYLEIVDNSKGDWGLVTLEDINTYYPVLPMVQDELAINLNEKVLTNPTYQVMRNIINPIISQITDEKLRLTFQKTFYATIDGISNDKGNWPGVLHYENDGSTFVYTGDIPGMWLRDSSAQVLPYLQFMNQDEEVRLMVKGILKKQFEQIRRDPYANAFNPDGSVFERKFELDSLAYPIWLASEYYRLTNDSSIFDSFFIMTARRIVETYKAELNHSDDNYRIENTTDRANGSLDVNVNSKLIWSGYRPSDDVNYYKFFIPGNMFAVVALEKISFLLTEFNLDSILANEAQNIASEVRNAIETYGVYNHPVYGKIYAFEVNGMTNDANSAEGKLLMDAANIPSLLSAPWLGYVSVDNEIYQNTRNFVLSSDNPYYYEGEYASGIGDPHDTISHGTNPHPETAVPWHMSIAMQALTSQDMDEIKLMVEYMTNTTGGAYVMHEAFNANDPTNYSRDYFTWPCSLYAHTVLTKILGMNGGVQ